MYWQHEEYNGARDHSSLKQYVLGNKQRLGVDAGFDDGDQFTDEGIPVSTICHELNLFINF